MGAEVPTNVFPLQGEETRSARGPLLLLMGAALLLLVVARGNVAAMLVGAGADRSRELAVREALGAGGRRLLRQLLVEGTVLAALGAAAGLALAHVATDALVLLAPADLPRVEKAALDPCALVVATCLAGLCGVVFGLTPALGTRRADLRRAMAADGRGASAAPSLLYPLIVAGDDVCGDPHDDRLPPPTARSVAGRTREVAIRMALGARRSGVLGQVLGKALRLALLGAAAGVIAALGATRLITAYRYGVEPTDLPTLIGTALLLAMASVVASVGPARRAARLDLVQALREE